MDEITLCRHGETEWSLSGQHTSFTDLPLTSHGEEEARALGKRLGGLQFDAVWTSPLKRAQETCQIAGFGDVAEVVPDLTEWNYGEYEGLTTPEIRKSAPGWTVFDAGAPSGESVEAVGARADRVIERLLKLHGKVLLFSSGHFSRVLAARWIGLAASEGRHLLARTASLNVLGYERETRVISRWNDTSHLMS